MPEPCYDSYGAQEPRDNATPPIHLNRLLTVSALPLNKARDLRRLVTDGKERTQLSRFRR